MCSTFCNHSCSHKRSPCGRILRLLAMSPCRAHSIFFVFTHPHPVGDESTGSAYSGSTVFPQMWPPNCSLDVLHQCNSGRWYLLNNFFSMGRAFFLHRSPCCRCRFIQRLVWQTFQYCSLLHLVSPLVHLPASVVHLSVLAVTSMKTMLTFHVQQSWIQCHSLCLNRLI